MGREPGWAGEGGKGSREKWPELVLEGLRPLQLLGLLGARPVAAEKLRNLFF